MIVAGCDLQREVVAQAHDTPYAGHFGQDITLDLARRFFWWPKMRQDVQEYVRTCDTCLHVKYQQKSPAGLLQPLLVPEQKWQSVSMDFIIEPSAHYPGPHLHSGLRGPAHEDGTTHAAENGFLG